MKVTQVIEDGAARATDLLSKLAETGGGAIKTRERLLAELKPELESLARIEEEHLFPVLQKNQEMRELVKAAAKDNKSVLSLVKELEGMPKDGDAFREKLIELRKAFQRSIRDDKKQLLPRIRKVMSDEDEQGLAKRMADSRSQAAEAEKTRKEAAEQARQRIVEAEAAIGKATETSAAVAGRAMDGASQGMEAAAHLPDIAMDTIGEAGKLLSDMTSRTAETGQRASRDIMRCGTPLEAVVVQARLMREVTEVWMDTGSRMVELSVRASQRLFPPGQN